MREHAVPPPSEHVHLAAVQHATERPTPMFALSDPAAPAVASLERERISQLALLLGRYGSRPKRQYPFERGSEQLRSSTMQD